MARQKKNLILGMICLFIGILTLMLFVFEVKDGVLQGSRSHGITEANNPIGFYVSTALEGLVGLFLLFCSIHGWSYS